MRAIHEAGELRENALFIADSHFGASGLGLAEAVEILRSVESKLETQSRAERTQIFLMGDIAHLLFGAVTSSVEYNRTLLECVARLAEKSELWWFEGNHDFGLRRAMESMARFYPALRAVRVIPRSKQPLCLRMPSGKRALLAHGDLFLNRKYEYYIRAMTSAPMGWLLYGLDRLTFGRLYARVSERVARNAIREGRADIESFASKRVEAYRRALGEFRADMIIEGHFHIGAQARCGDILYIALPSFYIHRSIFPLESALI